MNVFATNRFHGLGVAGVCLPGAGGAGGACLPACLPGAGCTLGATRNSTMHTLPLVALTLSLLSGAAVGHAQTVYKCGATYSQTPCGTGQQEVTVKAADPCEAAGNRYSDKCIGRSYSPSTDKPITLADRKKLDSAAAKAAQISEENATRNKQALAEIDRQSSDPILVESNKKQCVRQVTYQLKDPESARFGEPLRIGALMDQFMGRPVMSYSVSVNAKNSYGGYTGSKIWFCSFSPDEKAFVRAWTGSE
nr:DUF4124 domain-containing protein [uncultured Albidiferax sp.]